jgi:hypothetical protein
MIGTDYMNNVMQICSADDLIKAIGKTLSLRIGVGEAPDSSTAWIHRFGVLLGVLAVLALATGCRQKEASITLGQNTQENGLELISMGDGIVTPKVASGVPCVQLDTRSESYIYFAVAPSMKTSKHLNATLWVEFMAPVRGRFDVQYDGYKFGDEQDSIWSDTRTGILFDGSPEWNRVALQITNGRLENRQNYDADFRLRVNCPEFYVRRVKLTDFENSRDNEKPPN